MGYSRKYPHPPYGRHLIGYLKFSGFPGRTTAVFAGFQSLLIQNIKEFKNFAKIWMVFLEFRLKFIKFWGNLWISSHTHWAFLTGFPMSSIGGVWIFSGIAQYLDDPRRFRKPENILKELTRKMIRKTILETFGYVVVHSTSKRSENTWRFYFQENNWATNYLEEVTGTQSQIFW